MTNIDFYTPIMHCLKQRSAALGCPDTWDWVLHDPVVSCFAPALFLLDRDGYLKLSDHIRQTTKELYWSNTGFWIKREHQMKKIMQEFEEINVDFIPLKGAALLNTIYQRVGLRLMTDIDILVKAKDFLNAAELLLASGMLPEWQYNSGDLFEFKKLPTKYWPGGLSFYNQALFRIDLHQEFVTNHWFKIAMPVEMEQVWERCNRSDDGELNPWKNQLSPYDMLINLCTHLALHGLQNMKNFFDVDLFLRNIPPNWDWSQYISIAKKSQLCSATYHSFAFCQYFFNTPIPTHVMRTLRPRVFDRCQVRSLITAQTILKNHPSLGLRYPSLVKYVLFDGSRVKLKTIFNLLFPERTWMEHNPNYRGFYAHWSHIRDVFFRGD